MNDQAATEGFDIMHVGRPGMTLAGHGRTARVVLGGALCAAGAMPLRGWLRSLLLVSGSYLVLRELTRETRRVSNGGAPRRQKPQERDAVDEASWQSFPASDPPGF